MKGSEFATRSTTTPGSSFADGATAGVGSLPHLDPTAAARFAIDEFDIPTVPTMPNRSSEETMLAQALAGLAGVHVYRGEVTCDVETITPVTKTDLDHDAFAGLRAFLDVAGERGLDGTPVKWQFVGPVTLGLALHRAGVERRVAFDVALTTIRARLAHLSDAVTEVLPRSEQMVVLDEPWLCELMQPGFPIPPDEAIDRMSSAMAALPTTTVAGIHCCAPCDVATLLASGPRVVSLPVTAELVEWVGYLTRFLADGGIIAWGVVATDGPVPWSSERSWRALSDLWCELVQRGCDAARLRRQSIVTPQCGLTGHSIPVAHRITRMTAEVGRRVKDQSAATRFALGA